METILIADSHEIVRQGILRIIESRPKIYQIIEACTGQEVMEHLSGKPIKFAILDMQLADGNIFITPSKIFDHTSATPIFVYTAAPERVYAKSLLQKGIRGFLSKNANLKELSLAIETFLNGEIYLSASLKELLFLADTADTAKNPLETLSRRELEVVEYTLAGMGVNEIGLRLKLDITTVSTYRKRAFKKLDVENVMELAETFRMYKTQR